LNDIRMKKRPIRLPLFEVRHSRVHGYGVFAARRIRKGTTVIEYLGDRVSHDEADARYEDKDPNDNHTFLFTVDSKIVIDGGVRGNEARFINHGCDPNCASTTQKKRIYVEAIRTIQPGEELAYDYQIERDPDDPPNVDEIFACRCGAEKCRGSMLVARKKPGKRRSAKAAAKKAAGRTTAKAGRKTARKAARKAVGRPKKSDRSPARAARRAPSGRRGR
jgi:SET domain-containing protein